MSLPNIEFVIDETDLVNDFNISINRVEDKIKLIDICTSFSSSIVLITDDWENLQIQSEKLGNFIFRNEYVQDPNNRDIVLRWAYTINQLEKFSPEDYLKEEDIVKETPHFLAVIRSNEEKLAVVSFVDNFNFIDHEIKHVSCISDAFYFRDYIFEDYIDTEDKFWECSSDLYPNTYFHHGGTAMKINKMGFPINEIIKPMLKIMKYLDRHGQKEFSIGGQHFSSHAKAAGINLSQESSNTNNNKDVKKQRDIMIEGEIVHCEWHAKILPHKGRIHFNEGSQLSDFIKNVTKGKLVIGILCEHLDT